MRAYRMDRKVIADALNKDEVRSRIMKDGAFFDTFLGITLGLYFTSHDRFSESRINR
jgi:hypothetical protein